MDKLYKTQELLKNLKHDIRAEVVVNDLLSNNFLQQNQYVIQKEGQFSRVYRYDILNTEIVDFDYDNHESINFLLSRDSIYDALPEAVIHQSKNDTPDKGVDRMIKEYRIQKSQQKSARTFFQPFENEFFEYGVRIEEFEKNYLDELNGHIIPELFYDFWGISKELPPLLVSKFIRLLPFSYKIVGNIDLACTILSALLEEKVSHENKGMHQYSDENQAISLGEARLGMDFITGIDYDDYSMHLDIKIGPLKNASFTEYILDGKFKKFLEVYYEHLFPMEVDINTHILIPNERQQFEFNEKETPILGYNTRI